MGGKSFTRYFRDLEFRRQVDQQFAFADAAAQAGMWITYAIHDPSRADHIAQEQDGLIVYVGQTKEFGKRVRKRMRNAGTAVNRPTDRIDGACYDIMTNGFAPRFTVRDRVTTAIDSLISETNTAKRLIALGYPLLNQWTEQKFAGLEIDRHSVPHTWLWAMTAADAIGSNIELIISEKVTGRQLSANLADFPPNTRLREIKALVSNAGRQARLVIR